MQGKRKFDRGRNGMDRSYSRKSSRSRVRARVKGPFRRSQDDAPAELGVLCKVEGSLTEAGQELQWADWSRCQGFVTVSWRDVTHRSRCDGGREWKRGWERAHEIGSFIVQMLRLHPRPLSKPAVHHHHLEPVMYDSDSQPGYLG